MTAGVLVVILALTMGLMIVGHTLISRLGKNGAAVLIKVMGMLLAALSVELLMTALGVGAWAKRG